MPATFSTHRHTNHYDVSCVTVTSQLQLTDSEQYVFKSCIKPFLEVMFARQIPGLSDACVGGALIRSSATLTQQLAGRTAADSRVQQRHKYIYCFALATGNGGFPRTDRHVPSRKLHSLQHTTSAISSNATQMHFKTRLA